jgi:hypothetical protein
VITKRALSIIGEYQLFGTMSEEQRNEERDAAWKTYEVAKYAFIQRARIR